MRWRKKLWIDRTTPWSSCRYTPVTSEAFGTLTLSSFRVTFAPVVADALLGTVRSVPSLPASLRANCTLQINKEKTVRMHKLKWDPGKVRSTRSLALLALSWGHNNFSSCKFSFYKQRNLTMNFSHLWKNQNPLQRWQVAFKMSLQISQC